MMCKILAARKKRDMCNTEHITCDTGDCHDVCNDVNAERETEDREQPCYMRSDHQNVLGSLMCPTCNPGGKLYASESDSE